MTWLTVTCKLESRVTCLQPSRYISASNHKAFSHVVTCRSTLLLSWNNERATMLVSSLMRVAPCSFVKKSFASGHRSRHHHLCKFVATKESGYRVIVKLPQDLFKTPKWPPFTTWRTWRHVEKLYTLGKSYPFLKKPGQVTYVSLETNAYNATSKWLIRKGFKVKRSFAFNPLVYGLIWCIVFFVNRLHFSRFKMKKAELTVVERNRPVVDGWYLLRWACAEHTSHINTECRLCSVPYTYEQVSCNCSIPFPCWEFFV